MSVFSNTKMYSTTKKLCYVCDFSDKATNSLDGCHWLALFSPISIGLSLIFRIEFNSNNIDNDVNNVIIHCLNCTRSHQNSMYETLLMSWTENLLVQKKSLLRNDNAFIYYFFSVSINQVISWERSAYLIGFWLMNLRYLVRTKLYVYIQGKASYLRIIRLR